MRSGSKKQVEAMRQLHELILDAQKLVLQVNSKSAYHVLNHLLASAEEISFDQYRTEYVDAHGKLPEDDL